MSETAKVVTANRLIDGIAVFWTGARWSERFADAQALDAPSTVETAMAQAAREEASHRIVDAYAFEVIRERGRVIPARQRERVRCTGGPTVDDARWLMTAHY